MIRALVLRALGLGDLLTGIPALRGLRRAWPDAKLTLAAPAELGAWARSLGLVEDVLPTSGLAALAWPGPPPELAVNLHGRGPQSHRLLQALRPGRLVGYAAAPAGHLDGPQWRPDEHEVDRWVRLVGWAGGDCGPADLVLTPGASRESYVVLHPGAAAGSRRWAGARWAAVAASLVNDGRHVVVTGGPGEAQLAAEVAAAHPSIENRCGAYDLAGLADLVAAAALLLCGDTGVAHLATAYRTPSMLLFGPTSPRHWGPRIDGDRHRVLWQPREGDPPGDPHAAHCDVRLARITVAEVLEAAQALLGSAAGAGRR